MPGNNGTGPLGKGSMTGRGLGPCGKGARRGFGRGFDRGFRSMTAVPVNPAYETANLTKEQKKKILEAEKTEIQVELKEIEKRLKDLK